MASVVALFYLAQVLGVDWVQHRFREQSSSMLERIKGVGVVAIFAITAHPIGLLTPAHLAAGLVGLNAGQFALAVALAAPIRTAPYAFLGTAVLDLSVVESLSIAGVMILFFLLPLFFPKVRAWLWGERNSSTETR